MKTDYRYIRLAAGIWLYTALALGIVLSMVLISEGMPPLLAPFLFPASLVASIPALVVLSLVMKYIATSPGSRSLRIQKLVLLCFFLSACYGLPAGVILESWRGPIPTNNPAASILLYTLFVFSCALTGLAARHTKIRELFAGQSGASANPSFYHLKTNHNMETTTSERAKNNSSDKILIKGFITGILILGMLIPTWFVSNLVEEREQRQKQIVNEVSSKWASAQRLSGPYISLPYIESQTRADGKTYTVKKNIVLLPEQLRVKGNVRPESKHRSIYKVLVYRSDIGMNGVFNVSLPGDIVPENIDFTKARICLGLTDYKGIEEMVSVHFNNKTYHLRPGLPTNQVDNAGLSAPVEFSAADLARQLTFSAHIKLKGSNALSFLPLSANSNYELSSTWPDPSFDGSSLPSTSKVADSGFVARWSFNEANLPYGTVVIDESLKAGSHSFGVNLIQPADHYAKTLRSVKYAILFIGLTFALFFIIELMQKRPFHPVQYILVGIALVIFYTLLLSISEFIAFDLAYLAAASATVLLITSYAKGHFRSWKIALLFAGILGALYGFIFILIRLEDTALLVGSIGLFIVLALVMYASRKVNWYGSQPEPSV